MDKPFFVTVTFEVDANTLNEAETMLAAQGLTLEDALLNFFSWCARCPDEAAVTIQSWMAEEKKAEER